MEPLSTSAPTFTKAFHHATYPAITPTLPALSMTGKTIFITGGGYGIGAAIVKAFSDAGAANIIITGRTSGPLNATKTLVEGTSTAKILVFTADITDAPTMNTVFKQAFAAVGKLDVLVHNAGFLPTPALFRDADLSDWWAGFETNVLGAAIVARGFLEHAARNDAVFINVSTSLAHWPTPLPRFSGYAASKTAALRFAEMLQVENPGVRVMNVHPGLVATGMNRKSGVSGVHFDDVELSAHFMVWAASPEAEFLKGRLLWANWDVDELKARKDEIIGGNKLVLGLAGWE